MPISKEVWIKDIQEKLFPDNSFATRSVDHSAWIENKKVHVPQAGNLPTVTVNRDNTNGSGVTLREDADLEYAIKDYTTGAQKIPMVEEVETNYYKRGSVVQSHANVLNFYAMNDLALEWLPTAAASMVRTSGDAVSAAIPTATGTRKKLTLDDLNDAAKLLDEQDVPNDGRCILLPAYMYREFVKTSIKELLSLPTDSNTLFAEGKLIRVLGFEIHVRSTKSMPFYSNAATPVKQAVGTTLTTGNGAALCWHPNFVSRALGAVNYFEQLGSPEHYGDVISASCRAGGAVINSNLGVVAIVEAHGA